MNEPLKKTNAHVFLAEGEGIGAPGLAATKCRDCGAYTMGRTLICSQCFSRKVDLVAAGQKGTLVEHAVVHHSAGGFQAPYAIGFIKTTEGMVVMAPIDGDASKLATGMKLEFRTVPREAGAKLGFAYVAA
jgi:uncharacterized OB-fold protein